MYYFSTFIEKTSILQEFACEFSAAVETTVFFARNCYHKLIIFISYGSNYVGVTGYFVVVFISLETVYLYCKMVLTCSSLGCVAQEMKAFGSFKMLVTVS